MIMATTDQVFFPFVYIKLLERQLKFKLVKNEMHLGI